MMKNKILIVAGDPNSINSEIIYKSFKSLKKNIREKIYVISNIELLKKQYKKLKYKIKIENVKNINEKGKSNNLKVLDVKLKFSNPFNVSKINASNFVKSSLNYAHNLGLSEKIKGIINCSINKNLLSNTGIGVTEYLAKKCRIKNNSEVMLIRNKRLCVSPVTTHLDVRKISKNLKPLIIINKIKTINNWFKKKFGKKPKIAVLGLNPHNAELRKNSEEKKIIIPLIKKIKRLGLNVEGPLVADTIFINEYKRFDVIVGMYHDQVLGPFKSLFKFNAINITLGLKYLRSSPDHGTAKNLIGKNKGNPISLIECINFTNKFGK